MALAAGIHSSHAGSTATDGFDRAGVATAPRCPHRSHLNCDKIPCEAQISMDPPASQPLQERDGAAIGNRSDSG